VVLKNRKSTPLGVVPISINVLGPGGRYVFQNNAPGLEPSLVSTAALPPSSELAWVDDQVTPNGKATTVRAVAGQGGSGAPPALPKIDVGAPKLINDLTSGLEVTGKITNRSSVTQLKLFVYAVGRQGSKVVAAGRGAIARLVAGAHANYHIFLIGNPQGAQFTVYAPPTVLR
jgi:hypothetical protein